MAEEKKDVKPVEKPAEKKEAKPVKKEEKKEAKPVKKPEAKPVKPKEAPKEAKPAPKKEVSKPAPAKPAAAPGAPAPTIKRRKKKLKIKAVHAKAKKKSAVARASLKKGTGKFRVNKRDLNLIQPYYVLEYVREPLELAGEAVTGGVNVDVSVKGGGFMSQAVAVRGAIAKALVAFSKDKKLKDKYLKYDRMLLVDDPRQSEPKKPLGTGARRKKQSSKR